MQALVPFARRQDYRPCPVSIQEDGAEILVVELTRADVRPDHEDRSLTGHHAACAEIERLQRLVEIASRYWRTTSRYAEPDLGYRIRPWRETLGETITWLRENHPAGVELG